jgi:hypothetical protein
MTTMTVQARMCQLHCKRLLWLLPGILFMRTIQVFIQSNVEVMNREYLSSAATGIIWQPSLEPNSSTPTSTRPGTTSS